MVGPSHRLLIALFALFCFFPLSQFSELLFACHYVRLYALGAHVLYLQPNAEFVVSVLFAVVTIVTLFAWCR